MNARSRMLAPVAALLATLPACQWSPLQLSVWRDIQLVDEETPVIGARLGIVSYNEEIDAVDIDLLLARSRESSGLTLAPAIVGRYHAGVQLGLATLTPSVDGISVAIYNNWFAGALSSPEYPATVNGLQIGGFASVSEGLNGVQISPLANFAKNVQGLQIGAVNGAREKLEGVQVGLLNSANGGFQIGLLNWNDNGFLPVFPLFNF